MGGVSGCETMEARRAFLSSAAGSVATPAITPLPKPLLVQSGKPVVNGKQSAKGLQGSKA
jgi:hypothetical protein